MTDSNFWVDSVAVAPQQQIGPHSQSTWEVSTVLTGAGTRTVGDSVGAIAEGEVVLIPPGINHHWQFDSSRTTADGCIRNISVSFTPLLLTGLREIFPELAPALERLSALSDAIVFTGEAAGAISEIMRRLAAAVPAERPQMMIALLGRLSDIDGGSVVCRNPATTNAGRKLERLRVFCKCNFDKEISSAQAAAHLGMTHSALCRFMRRNTGATFSAYINAVRIEHATHLLADTDMAVSEIAYRCGFGCVPSFNRVFKLAHGISPTAYRRRKTLF